MSEVVGTGQPSKHNQSFRMAPLDHADDIVIVDSIGPSLQLSHASQAQAIKPHGPT